MHLANMQATTTYSAQCNHCRAHCHLKRAMCPVTCCALLCQHVLGISQAALVQNGLKLKKVEGVRSPNSSRVHTEHDDKARSP